VRASLNCPSPSQIFNEKRARRRKSPFPAEASNMLDMIIGDCSPLHLSGSDKLPYLYELLDSERFQHFCQALLVRDYPDLQCFPVGQPDGGRDALSRGSDGEAKIVVGQVKFKRVDETENAQWMIDALVKEKPKIERLAARGATRYLMMTNARGTAHEDVGRIDLVQEWLDKNISIPSMVLWRDELDRRLDGADSALKLTYPSILTGADTLTLMVAAQMGPHKERIERTLRAFVAEQYRKDEEVKFRQVELANSLLALFVDVPIDVSRIVWPGAPTKLPSQTRHAIMRAGAPVRRTAQSGVVDFSEGYGRFTVGAADLLLDSDVQAGMPWTVLQGAPGQGKSTLAQYVCQVHRARYLDKKDFIGELPDTHLNASFRMPIKVDLRDLAAYLANKPYLGLEEPPTSGARTLERFVASLVSIQSGGLVFSADDFAEIASGIPILLFLDGLDEVADLDLRRVLIEKILEGLNRLKEGGSDLQVVVTSRPSLFGRAPSFSKAFERLNLAPIDDKTVHAYANKWVLARRLNEDRGAEVLQILREKLELPHIRELTKNPMQLTILLSLILSIGHSLPDVRTDLYREYMNLFMTREAEKSPVVREHRALLLEIVEHLAWTLQSGAESDRQSGSISGADIRKIIAEFLDRGDHETAILDDLFTGGLERVYVLVQRVEGLYEFEVQPLREYFAAKHLYSSAPVGTFRHLDAQGDRAQRFEAMAANPYWANVTRFYAGFYEGGEIGALSLSLRELVGSKDIAVSLNARSIAAALLTDWIFKSKKYVQTDVIRLVFDPTGVSLASIGKLSGFEAGSLDKQCGRDVLARILFEDHVRDSDTPASMRVCLLLRRNGGRYLASEFEAWISESSGQERSRRFHRGSASGALVDLEATALETLVFDDEPEEKEIVERLRSLVIYGSRSLAESERLFEASLDGVLKWGGFSVASTDRNLSRLAGILNGVPFGRAYFDREQEADEAPFPGTRVAQLNETLAKVDAAGLFDQRGISWQDPDVWSRLIEIFRESFGDTWSTYRLAALSVGLIKTGAAEGVGKTDHSDASIPLFTRAATAKAWRGRASWWADRLTDSAGVERLFWLSLLLLWGPSKHVSSNLSAIESVIDDLTNDELEQLEDTLDAGVDNRRLRGGRMRNGVDLAQSSSRKVAYMMLLAFGDAQLPFTPSDSPSETRLHMMLESKRILGRLESFEGWTAGNTRSLNNVLQLFKEAQEHHVDLPESTQTDVHKVEKLSVAVATKVLKESDLYPMQLVAAAHSKVQLAYKPVRVREIAVNEGWQFE
jgi:hypothetical protein